MTLFERLGLTSTPPSQAFQEANAALVDLAPSKLSALLNRHPRLHPLSAEPFRDTNGDTLLHAWARLSPDVDPDALSITRLLLGKLTMEHTHTNDTVVLTPQGGNEHGETPQMLAARHVGRKQPGSPRTPLG